MSIFSTLGLDLIRLFSYFVGMERNKDTEISTQVNYTIPVKLRHGKRVLKLTVSKQKQFLELIHKEYNWTKAAATIGVTRKAIEYLHDRDERFREAVKIIKDSWLDRCEEAGLDVASLPTREGYNDRKLFLTAHRKEYQQKPQFQQNILITGDDQKTTITQILQEHMPTQNITVDKSRKNKEIEQENKKAKTVT